MSRITVTQTPLVTSCTDHRPLLLLLLLSKYAMLHRDTARRFTHAFRCCCACVCRELLVAVHCVCASQSKFFEGWRPIGSRNSFAPAASATSQLKNALPAAAHCRSRNNASHSTRFRLPAAVVFPSPSLAILADECRRRKVSCRRRHQIQQ
jgi:hypothetical protein